MPRSTRKLALAPFSTLCGALQVPISSVRTCRRRGRNGEQNVRTLRKSGCATSATAGNPGRGPAPDYRSRVANEALEVSVAVPARPRASVDLALVGVSEEEICGVRDHGALLADALRSEGVSCTTHWLTRTESGWRAERWELREWLASVSQELAARRPDAIVFQYSSFAYSHRGLPVHVRAVRAALRRARVPLIIVAHEL